MASSTSQYAAGDLVHRTTKDSKDESTTISGRKRKTLFLHEEPRPLFVAEAEFRAAKVFTRVKKCMLVLTGAEVLVLNVAALEAAEAAAAGGDMSLAVLRLISYRELLEVSICGSSSLKIEYGDSSDKPKLASASLFGAVAAAGTASSEQQQQPGGLASSSASTVELYGGASSGGAAGMSGAGSSSSSGAASIRVTFDYFTLAFKDPATAQEAAAAMLFQRAQYAAMRQWLYQGLHAGLRCDPVSLQALPLSRSSSSGSGSKPRGPSQGGSTAAATAAAAAPYPWGSVSSGWGSSIPLPASWAAYLAAAAASAEDAAADTSASASVAAADEPEIHMEDLSCSADLTQGPEALLFTFSTPLGAAKALITPQLVRAALLNSKCREVLAVPAQKHKAGSSDGKQQQQQGPAAAAGFSWTVSGRVPAVLSPDGSSTNLAASAGMGQSAGGAASDAHDTAAAGGAGVGFFASHRTEVYAAVTVEVVATAHTVGRRGAGRVFDPDSSSSSSSSSGTPAAATAAAAAAAPLPAVAEAAGRDASEAGAPSAELGTSSSSSSSRGQQLQLAAYVLLAAMAGSQLSSKPAWALLQLLLLGAVAVLQLHSSSSSSRQLAGDRRTTAAAAAKQAAAGSSGPKSVFNDAGGPDQAAADAGGSSSSSTPSEDVTCCGWSLRLVAGDVVAVPGRHLQLQIAMARADRGLTALRQRMASMNLSMGGAPPLASLSVTGGGVPTLVSDPEPSWLHPDNKQRFLNAKPTLEASREQAVRTHRWRQRCNVDSVLTRPCDGFEKISATFPTYTLLDNSPDGHAVVLMKVGCIKDLCDLVFNPPDGVGVTLEQVEQALALFNEYLVHVAAPNPLPAGFQVQFYDMEGFKLSYVMGDMLTLFKLLVRFGHYYPERLHQALVINAPAWFSYPWKLMNAFLDANTSAKVVVVGSPKSALATIAHHMGGIANVPAAWGGKNTTPIPEYPAHRRMIEFARRLNAGEQPLQDVRRQQD
uniref:CRAL-TRIO domain-containing protein n=1 Tax=Tetradesmus obliquus TaxID=3088 RepID=A0A383VP05_TETOB|eukprot:jgi/Sobl393_1/12387/SZX66633.1